MSKQSEAKKEQGYVERAPQNVCGNCAHYRSAMSDYYGYESEKKCTLGGFAVKKLATCNKHEPTTTLNQS